MTQNNLYADGRMSKLAYFVEFRYWQDEAAREGTEDPAEDNYFLQMSARELGMVPV